MTQIFLDKIINILLDSVDKLYKLIMFKQITSKNLVFQFSAKAFDLAIIGGGPGGIFMAYYRLCCCHQSFAIGIEHCLY
jgi:hypothetical protein